jgi:transcription elongation factor Elf1
MGRRKKAAKKVVAKKRPTVAKSFKCLFCNHDDVVSCTMDHKGKVGELNCRICDAKFQTQITSLTDPIDVFSEWLDETQDRQKAELTGVDDEDED